MVKLEYARQSRDLIKGQASVSGGSSSTIVDASDTSLWGGLVIIFERLEIVNGSGATATVTVGDGTTTWRTVVVADGEMVDIAPEVIEAGSKLVIGSNQNVTINYEYVILPKDLVSFKANIKT